MSEFCLNEKGNKQFCNYLRDEDGRMIEQIFFKEKDVKEFIKRDGDIIQELIEGKISCARMWLKREKLAGEKLI